MRQVDEIVETARGLLTMDEPAYRAWWALHLRAVRGESLDASAASLTQARALVQSLEAEHSRLRVRREELDAEIAALEAILDRGTREQLAMKD
jgi:hypothetical protein